MQSSGVYCVKSSKNDLYCDICDFVMLCDVIECAREV